MESPLWRRAKRDLCTYSDEQGHVLKWSLRTLNQRLPQCCRRPQSAAGDPRAPLETPECPGRPQSTAGDPRALQETPERCGRPRAPLETPEHFRRPQNAAGDPRALWDTPSRRCTESHPRITYNRMLQTSFLRLPCRFRSYLCFAFGQKTKLEGITWCGDQLWQQPYLLKRVLSGSIKY